MSEAAPEPLAPRTARVTLPRGVEITLGLHDDGWALPLAHVLNQRLRTSRDRVTLEWRADEGEPTAVTGEIDDAFERVSMGERTILHIGATCGRHFCATLTRTPAVPWYPAVPWRSFAGRPAFIIGAGPSLDLNIEHLAAAKRHGPIIATQTAVAPLLAAGVEPDIVVCVESASCALLLARVPRHIPILLDARAHPDNFAATDHPIAFVNHEPCLAGYAAALASVPLPYSTMVGSSATSLAIHQGAAHVVLVGMDMAYTDGRCYARNTKVDDVRATVDHNSIIRFSHASDSASSRGFVGERGTGEPVRYRDRWGGGEPVASTHGLDQLALWFERAAQSFEIINATEGGSRVAHTTEMRLKDVLALSDDDYEHGKVTAPPEPADTSAIVARMRAAAHRVIADDGICLPPHDLPLLNLWVAGAHRAALGLSQRERYARLRDASVLGAREVLAALDANPPSVDSP